MMFLHWFPISAVFLSFLNLSEWHLVVSGLFYKDGRKLNKWACCHVFV